jgi:hypothetical protein
MKSSLKKIITFFVICVLAFNTAVPAVNAIVPAIPIIEGPLGPVPTSDKAIRLKEVGITKWGITWPGVTLDGIVILATKALLQQLSDDVVTWINNGFDGGPGFATDPADFFLGVADQVAIPFIEDVGLSALCSPFRAQIEGALRISYNSSLPQRDRYVGSCTISGIVGNFENFLSGDFAEGGWEGWITMTQNQDSNPFGAMITAQSTLAARIASATGIAEQELSWSKGFLSSRECSGTGSEEVCVTTTPGTVIEGQLQKVLGSEINQLELADELDEMIGALLGQLAARVFGGNPRGLIPVSGGQTKWAAGGFGSSRPLAVYSCTPDKDVATLDGGTADIKWRVSSTKQGSTYEWTGDDPINGLSGEEVTASYTTSGFKKASVTVTENTMIDGQLTTTTLAPIQCQPDVEIKKYPPITGACFPILATDYNSTLNFDQLGSKILRATKADREGYTLPIVWVVFPQGGSGAYQDFRWSSRKAEGPSDFKPGDENFNSFIRPGSVPLHSVSQVGYYYRGGDRTVTVNILDQQLNEVDVEEITCAVLKVY